MRRARLPLIVAACAAALAGPTAAADATVSVGQSGWFWGSPLPQGNTLRAVELTGGRGYASGAFGTVLATEDGGQTWSGLTTGVTADLSRLRVIGPDSFVVGGGCVLRRSDDGGKSFERLPFSAGEAGCPAPLASFHFPTSTIGYLLLRDGTVTRTDDGGKTFSRRTAVPSTQATGGNATPTDVTFTTADTGVALTSGEPRIYRTTDGGLSWAVVHTAGAGLRSVTFVDAQNGYAVGEGSSVFATADGGETWTRRPLNVDSPPATLTQIRCTELTTCLIATAAGDRILRTTDGAETARAISPSTDPIFAATFASSTRVVGVGAQGATVLSDDSGNNYRPIGGRLPGRYTGVRAASAQVAYALGANGALARTADGGQTWTPGAASTSEDLKDVSFPTPETGFVLDTAGALLRTDNGGQSWRILNTGASAPPQAVLAPTKDTIVLVGPQGLRRSADGGEEFSAVGGGRKVSRARVFGADKAGGAIVAYGPQSILISGDGGESWRAAKRPGKSSLRAVDFLTARSGYAIDRVGRTFKTGNGGRSWRELAGVGGTNPVALSFAEPRSGWALLPSFGGELGGYVLRTDDGGDSWRPQLIAQQQLPGGLFAEPFVVATSATSAIALAGGPDSSGPSPSARLFATTTGGDAGAESTMELSASARKVKRARPVTIRGTLAPAEGGETAVVFSRASGRGWEAERLRVASNGTFSMTVRPTRSTVFVAQWQGDDDRRSDGTKPLRVTVQKAKKKKSKAERRGKRG